MNKHTFILLLFLCLSMLSRKPMHAQEPTPFADENVDDLEDVSDAFQESFFEALKQKAIQNHDRAISALNKCIELEPDRAFLYFERAKNQGALKQYDLAEQDLVKALELDPDREPMLALLYDVYYKTRDYIKAEEIVKKLIAYNTQYKEDLARIYTQTRQFEEAIGLLDELDIEKGIDLYREQLRTRIYKQSGDGALRTRASEAMIIADPKNEAAYLKLIFLYSEEGNNAKAYETALKLQKINPDADEVQLALYKFYLEDGKVTEAIEAMNKVLRSTDMDGKVKHRVLNDFLTFVNQNPTYQPQLEEAIAIFDTQVVDANVYQQLANYHLKKGEKIKGLKYLEKALAADLENFELIKNTVLLQLDTQQYESATRVTSQALDLFPSQAILYLAQGVAYTKLGKYDAAIESLEIGVDYIIENVKMESDFYQQLGEAYTGKGNVTKANAFLEKAKSLKAQLD